MSEYALYREPTVLDFIKHRNLRFAPLTDHTAAAGMHACFLAAAEFTRAAVDFVIVFVRDELEGRQLVQPIVMMGVQPGENLFITGVPGARWDARYVPAYVRRYPFWTARLEGVAEPAVLFDAGCKAFSETEGEPLYIGENQPAPRLAEALAFIERFEVEAGRTLEFCARVDALGLLREMNANVTLADGSKLALNGFLTVDEDKLHEMPEAALVEVHRNGMLGLLHAHLLSLGNLEGLADRKNRRVAQNAVPPAPAADPG